MSNIQEIIKECFESVRDTFEEDTEETLKQMESLRQVNTTTTLKYIKKEEDLKTLGRKADHVSSLSKLFFIRNLWNVNSNAIADADLRGYNKMLDEMEARLDFIEQLTEELDQYTKDQFS